MPSLPSIIRAFAPCTMSATTIGVHFLVMEYLEGQTLADRLRKGPMPLKEALKIGIDVCEALEIAQRSPASCIAT